MDVVIHKNEGVNGNVVSDACFAQQPPVMMAILIVDEDRRPVHAPLGDV